MAKNSEVVTSFLDELWKYSLPNAKKEASELQKMMDKEGKVNNLKRGTGGIMQKNFVRRNMI